MAKKKLYICAAAGRCKAKHCRAKRPHERDTCCELMSCTQQPGKLKCVQFRPGRSTEPTKLVSIVEPPLQKLVDRHGVARTGSAGQKRYTTGRLQCGLSCGEVGACVYDTVVYGPDLEELVGTMGQGSVVEVTVRVIKAGKLERNPWWIEQQKREKAWARRAKRLARQGGK